MVCLSVRCRCCLLLLALVAAWVPAPARAGFVAGGDTIQLPTHIDRDNLNIVPAECPLTRWRMKCIPYVMDTSSFPAEQVEHWKGSIEYAAQQVNDALEGTGIKLVGYPDNTRLDNRQNPPCSWIRFTYVDTGGCASRVGRVSPIPLNTEEDIQRRMCTGEAAPVFLTKACYDVASRDREVLHELMHRLGLCHEHQRFDADQHIDVLPENWPGAQTQIWPHDSQQIRAALTVENTYMPSCRMVGVYDKNSVMHYDGVSGNNVIGGDEKDFFRPKGKSMTQQGDMGIWPFEPAWLTDGDKAALKEIIGPCEGDAFLDEGGGAVQYCGDSGAVVAALAGSAAVAAVAGASYYYSRKKQTNEKRREAKRRDRRRSRKAAGSSSRSSRGSRTSTSSRRSGARASTTN